ncbi:DUF6527 family protein [Janthinobacterium sp. ZB1P44]|uniref:DUF6527 family protein n=1 Tax=Janthinobacterium sp. ZB1P44 TaxID=3424192 RepID=UPI003F2844B9
MIRWIEKCWITIRKWLTLRRKVVFQVGDMLPARLPKRDLVLLQDDGENWSVGFRCPCGCGDTIELPLLHNVKPRWDIRVDARRRPTLAPSVWKTTGCKSHFWVRDGKIVWV